MRARERKHAPDNGAPLLYTPRILGFAEYVPQKENRLLLERVQAVLRDFDSYLPLTLRQAYYRIVSLHPEYPKTEAFYERLGVLVTRCRRAGLLDWESIRDDGVQSVTCGDGYADKSHFFRNTIWLGDDYTRDKHRRQPRQVILMPEAAGMVPQLQEAVGDLPVLIQTCGGMDSVTAKHGLAKLCVTRNTTILHVGDWDPGGCSIYHGIMLDVSAMMRDMRERFAAVRDFHFKRVAVRPGHVAEYGLLTGRRKPGDKDKEWFPGIDGDPERTCQAEALPPDVLVKLVQRAVRAEVDMVQHERDVALETKERRSIQKTMKEKLSALAR